MLQEIVQSEEGTNRLRCVWGGGLEGVEGCCVEQCRGVHRAAGDSAVRGGDKQAKMCVGGRVGGG